MRFIVLRIHQNFLRKTKLLCSTEQAWASRMQGNSRNYEPFIQRLELFVQRITQDTNKLSKLSSVPRVDRATIEIHSPETYCLTSTRRYHANIEFNRASQHVISWSSIIHILIKAQYFLRSPYPYFFYSPKITPWCKTTGMSFVWRHSKRKQR